MNIPRPTNPVRLHEIKVSEDTVIEVYMVNGNPGEINVFAMEWTSKDAGQTGVGAIKIGPDTFSNRSEADQRFDSIVSSWDLP